MPWILQLQAFKRSTQFPPLFQESKSKPTTLKPIILDEIVGAHKNKIKEVVQRESVAPSEHLRLYDKYDFLISKKAEKDTDLFLEENHHYERIIEEIRKYQKLVEEIQYTSRKVSGWFYVTVL